MNLGRTAFIAVLLLIYSQCAYASEAFYFEQTAINSIKSLSDEILRPIQQHLQGDAIFEAVMKRSIENANAINNAIQDLNRFSSSGDTDIKQSVALLNGALMIIMTTQNQVADECEKILNTPKENLPATQGTVYRQLYELEAKASSNWEDYVKVGGVAINNALIDSHRLINGKLYYLKISQAERHELKDELISAFGPRIRQGVTKKTPMVEWPAYALWTMLNKDWKSSDSKL